MLKRILQSCAAAALMATSAFAADASGTYTAHTAGGNLVIELHPLQQDLLRGTVHIGQQDYPIIAKQVGDDLNGTWEYQGRHVPFTSTLHDHTLTLKTNGATYELEKAADLTPVRDNDTPVIQPDIVRPEPRELPEIDPQPQPRPQIETHEGRAFRYDVPAGWKANESNCGVDLIAPDKVTIASHVLLVTPGKSSPDVVMNMLLKDADDLNWKNPKLESSNPCNQNGAQGTLYTLNYEFHGTQVHTIALIIVFNEAKRSVARIVVLQSTPEIMKRDSQKLMDLAHKIVVTHPKLVAGNEDESQPQPRQREVDNRDQQDQMTPDQQIKRIRSDHDQVVDDAAQKMDNLIRRDNTTPRYVAE